MVITVANLACPAIPALSPRKAIPKFKTMLKSPETRPRRKMEVNTSHRKSNFASHYIPKSCPQDANMKNNQGKIRITGMKTKSRNSRTMNIKTPFATWA